MSNMVMDEAALKAGITQRERAKRAAAIKAARTSVRLEGYTLGMEAEALFARYVDGELTRPQLNAAVLALAGARGS